MKSNKNNHHSETSSGVSSNYDLKSEAVEKLANADSGETPEFSQEELNKYRSNKGFRIPEWVKILFVKAWFAGAVCYFFFWGLGSYISSLIDMLFVLGVALGIVTDLLTNNIIRFIEKTPDENNRWMMIPNKGMLGFFLNIVYSFVILFCVYMLYNVINYSIMTVTGDMETVPLGVEPILFGVFSMAFDMLFVGIKRLIGTIISDARAAAGRGGKDRI